MSSPTHCEACGHALGIGRFCTNCGRPVPGRHPEAAPLHDAPASAPVPPVAPPTPTQTPPAARYPLFADGGDLDDAPAAPLDEGGAFAPGGLIGSADWGVADHDRADRRRTPVSVWIAGVVAVAVIAALGLVLVVSSGGDDEADDPTGSAPAATASPSGDAGGPDDDATGPDARGTDGPVQAPDADDVVELAREADLSAQVPAVANTSRDSAGEPVTFAASNMYDGDPRTCWRMPGDGAGSVLTFDLGRDAVITEVGLINGYAKVDGPNDWYPSNRRVRAVQWQFDDGTRVTQRFERRRTLQSMDIDPVATRTVRLRILEVSPPGRGTRGRDFTPISEISLQGAFD